MGTRLQVVAYDKVGTVLYERIYAREDNSPQYDFTHAINVFKMHPDLDRVEMTITWPKETG